MPTLNEAARNLHVLQAAQNYQTAELRDSGGTLIRTASLSWSLGDTGEAVTGPHAGNAEADADFASGGTLTLIPSSGEARITFTAGAPGSGAETIVTNDKSTPDGEVFEGKALTISQIKLTLPAA